MLARCQTPAGRRHHGLDLVRVGDVGLDELCSASVAPNALHDLVAGRPIQVSNRDEGSTRGCDQSGRRADSRGAAGDQNGLS
jgi:hypothetical protein